jgi:hypothetical protein
MPVEIGETGNASKSDEILKSAAFGLLAPERKKNAIVKWMIRPAKLPHARAGLRPSS